MKKHILGLTIFSFIFALFAIAFTFLNLPLLPKIAEVEQNINDKQPTLSYGTRYCSLYNRKELLVEVVNSEFYFDEGKIVSEVKLIWNGAGAPPEGIYLLTAVNSDSKRELASSFDGVYRILKNPFENAPEKTVKIVSRMSVNKKMKTEDNLFVVAIASEFAGDKAEETNKSFSERKEVVFIHGESSSSENK